MSHTLTEILRDHDISRRSFLKFCATTAALLALPPTMIPNIAQALETAKRQSVIWLSFQECTGCTESLTRAHEPNLEGLIFNYLSLDYHHTLQAAAGDNAEHALEMAMQQNQGDYIVIVDGSVGHGGYSTIAGHDNVSTLKKVAAGAKAIIAMGSCAAFGGLPMAFPNPTGAQSVSQVIQDKPIINVPGCPPIPMVIVSVIAHVLTFGRLPELDNLKRPLAFYGQNIHDRCYRRPFYERGQFANSFDDEGAKKGWCLYKLGCKGPVTYNACATMKWNDGTSFPIESGHGCLGCSQPDFWDAGGFYQALSVPLTGVKSAAGYALAAGAAVGLAAGTANALKKARAIQQHQPVTINDLEKDA